jgi:hypothetical protein
MKYYIINENTDPDEIYGVLIITKNAPKDVYEAVLEARENAIDKCGDDNYTLDDIWDEFKKLYPKCEFKFSDKFEFVAV